MAWVRCCGGGIPKPKYIFKDGVLRVAMNAYAYKASGDSGSPMSGSIGISPEGYLNLAQGGDSYGITSYITDAIDLTNISGIRIKIQGDNGYVNGFYCYVTNAIQNNYTKEVSYSVAQPRAGAVINLNVATLTGNHYLAFEMNTANTYYKQVQILEIELIP